MIRTRFAVFLLGLCGSFSFAHGQAPVVESGPLPVVALPYINPLYVNQWVGLDAKQGISGKLLSLDAEGLVVPRQAVEVSLSHKGKTVAQAMTEQNGSFRFEGIDPGTYSFVAASDFTFATFGFHVLPAGSGSPSEFEVYASTIPASRVRELISENWVPRRSAGSDVTFQQDPLSSKRVISAAGKVRLHDGDLVGQVSRAGLALSEQDLTGNVAHIFQGGRSVASAPVSRDGKFRIKNLKPGVYDLVVIGEAGTAVVGFEAIGPAPLATAVSTGAGRLVSFQDVADSLNVELADSGDFVPSVEEVPPPLVTDGAPFAGGFGGPGGSAGGGGGGMGGGGGGGMGGGGGLLGIAGLAIGVAALANDDEFDPGLASLIAP